MAEYMDREHYLPIRYADLVGLLSRELGAEHPALPSFRHLATRLTAAFNFEYAQLLHQLKDQYAAFDPDQVTEPIRRPTPEETGRHLDAFDDQLGHLMARANFKRLTFEQIKELAASVSEWGLNMDVDFDIFERLEVFVRGDTEGSRFKRRWYRIWRREEVRLPMYRRLVLFVKLKPSKRVPADIDTTKIYLKLFKDIPKVDLEMLLPGARMRMPGFTRLRLGSSIIGSGGWLAYNMFNEFVRLATSFSAGVVYGPLAALLGYGYTQWYGYQTAKTTFNLRLTQHLYFQTLGTNLSVLFHILDEAEEQESREALLAYYYLWRHAGPEGWTAVALDDFIEAELQRLAGVKVDFEISDALAKLERMKLVVKTNDRYVAEPIEQALAELMNAFTISPAS